MLEIKKTYIFFILFFCFEKYKSLFCYRDIPSMHNGYCVSNKKVQRKTLTVMKSLIIHFITSSNDTAIQ